MLEVALLTLLSVLAAVAFGVLHRREPRPTALWTWACFAVFGSGLCNVLSGEVPGIMLLAQSLGTAYPFMLLAGALAYAERRVPRGLIPLGLALGAVRGLAAQAGLPLASQGIGLLSEPTTGLAAAFLCAQVARDPLASGSQRALGPALALLAIFDGATTLLSTPGGALPPVLFGGWVIGVPLCLALQIAAASDRTERELRDTRSHLEKSVADRTADLARSLSQLEQEVRDRTAAEAALRESEERYRTISQLSSDYAFCYRVYPDGSRVNEWTTGTQALTRMTGFELDELTDDRWRTLLLESPDHDRLRDVVDPGGASGGEFRIRTKTGERRWMSFRTGGQQQLEDGSYRIIGTARDITERRVAEEERRRLELHLKEMQRIDSLGVLAGGIAHDFNNMLTVILGNVRLALADLRAGGSPEARLARIRSAADHASDLTQQMLTYSGKGSLALHPLDVSELVHEMLDLLRASAKEKATVVPDLAEDLPPVEGDATQLRQVVLNLVTNASDALGGETGTVRLRTGVLQADTEYLADVYGSTEPLPGDYVFFEVSDTGPGMPEHVVARVFEPFFTTKETGRGLGLAAVLGIVRSHDGVIKVASAPGVGTIFRVLLPASSQVREAAGASPPRPRVGSGRGRILVVDDDEAVLDVTQEFLKRAGFEVETAMRGDAALELFRERGDEIDALVLDLSMPGLSGEEVLLQMRQLRPGLPVVLASGFAEQHATERFTRFGVSEFLTKPYSPEQLAEAVTRAIDA